jgi:hypothetical protein
MMDLVIELRGRINQLEKELEETRRQADGEPWDRFSNRFLVIGLTDRLVALEQWRRSCRDPKTQRNMDKERNCLRQAYSILVAALRTQARDSRDEWTRRECERVLAEIEEA